MAAVLLVLLTSPFAARAADGDPPTPKAYADFAFSHDGDIERGRRIFLTLGQGACVRCHSVDGTGGKAGPDLFAVGDTHPRRDLIDAVLEPSATIAIGYDATIIQTRSGSSHYGVIKQAGAEVTELIGLDGQTVRIPTAEITVRQGSPISLMPAGLHTTLKLQEFTDLIEFLVSLKQPANSLSANRGMPESIPVAARPVTLRPFFREEFRFEATVVKKPGDVRSGLVWFGQVPKSPGVYLGIQQRGKIWRIEKAATGDTRTLWADFTPEVFSERGPNGLVSLAFHPQFRENRRYFLKHQALEAGEIVTYLVEKKASADFRRDSGEPSRLLMKIPTVTQNHTGGCIEFGPDGYLYLGMGDTGPQQDPNGHGQNLGLWLGKMLRIDVDHQDPGLAYAIPADNPLRGVAGARPEIYAWGFREPWRFTFDPATGDLWVGDVGQNRVEEVTIVRRGENHGWNVFEGFEPYSNLRRKEGQEYVPPVMAYKRHYGNSVTGGYVYRGDQAPSFRGVYVFGDYTSHLIWGLTQKDRRLERVVQIATSPESIASFGTDEAGRIFVVGYEGMVYELDFSTGAFPAAEAKPL